MAAFERHNVDSNICPPTSSFPNFSEQAFKKGDVDMPDAHRHVTNMNAITLADDLTEFDILLPEAALNLNR
jgi:hypothetical protein